MSELIAEQGEDAVTIAEVAARGEMRLHHTAVLDGIVAPIYLRHLFRVGGIDDAYLTGLVRRLLTPVAPVEEVSSAPARPAAYGA